MRAAPFFLTLAAMAMMPFGGQAHASLEPCEREGPRRRLPWPDVGGRRLEYSERRSEADRAALDAADQKRSRRRVRAADLAERVEAGRSRARCW